MVKIIKILEYPLNQNRVYIYYRAGLNKLHKIQQQFYPIYFNYYFIDTGIILRSVFKKPLIRSILYLQKYSRNLKDIIIVEDYIKEL